VLVGESSEASAAMYAVGWGGDRDVAVVGRSSQTDPTVLVASAGVVALDRGLQQVAAMQLGYEPGQGGEYGLSVHRSPACAKRVVSGGTAPSSVDSRVERIRPRLRAC